MNEARGAGRRANARGAGIVGALLLVAGLVLVATGVVALVNGAAAGGDDDLGVAAAALRARVELGVANAARALEPKAASAARLPEIASGLDLDADAHTFEDLLENEDWWAPYRAEFQLSGVITATGALAVLGAEATDLSGAPIVRQARDAGVASGIAAIEGTAYLLAAARVPRGKRAPGAVVRAPGAVVRAPGAVVIIGTPFERTALQRVADDAATAVALSDGKRVLAAAGPDAAQTKLAALVGRESRAGEAGLVSTDDGHPGLAVALDRGLWLDAALATVPPPVGARLGLVIGAAGLLLGGAGLVIQLSGRRRRAVDGDIPSAITPPASGPHPRRPTREEIERTALHPVPAAAAGSALPPAAAAAMLETPPAGPGVTLGRYRLLERIGEGGMAEIFIAAAHGAEGFVRHFVVKRMHPHMTRSRDAVNQFIDEGRLQSGLVHSNIVPVFDFGRVGEEYFLALEYIHGRDLERLIRRHIETFGRPLSVPVAFYVMHEVLEALAYAHARARRGRQDAGDRAPRRLAGKHPGVGQRRGEAVGLRHRQGGRAHEPDRGRPDQGQRQLHVSRAGARRSGRPALRPVLGGGRPLLRADRAAPLQGRDDVQPPDEGGLRTRGPRVRAAHGAAADRRRRAAEGARARTRETLSVGPRVRARARRPLHRRPLRARRI